MPPRPYVKTRIDPTTGTPRYAFAFGHEYIRLPDDPDSEAFDTEYRAAHALLIKPVEAAWQDAIALGMERFATPSGAARWRFDCERCGTSTGRGERKTTHPRVITRHLQSLGWALRRDARPLCPGCAGPQDHPVVQALETLLAGQHPGRFEGTPTELLVALEVVTTPDFRIESGRWPRTGSRLAAELARLAPALHAMGIHISNLSESNARMQILRLGAGDARPAPSAPEPEGGLKLQRRVMALLEARFDETAGHYRGGYTDAQVAKEADATETAVERIRTDAFGALAEDPGIAHLREDLELLRMEYEEGRERIANELTNLGRSLEEQRSALGTRLDELARARKSHAG